MASLFADDNLEAKTPAPLADRMRPRSLDEVLGQDSLLAKGSAFRTALENGVLGSLVLVGPPGVGKTSLARLIGAATGARFMAYSAVLSGVKELRQAMKEAQARRARGASTLLFVDEIHRFNKAQQDAFLPFVERGDVTLVGATTENPSFALIPALLSRLTVYSLQPLSAEELMTLVQAALRDSERGLGRDDIDLEPGALESIVLASAGDARRALSALEIIAASLGKGEKLSAERAKLLLGRTGPRHDRAGDRHFDILSAFHKSLRNSDHDAALYYMVRLLEGGEDPLVVVRRMCAFAAEDVGLADPQALQVALAALESVRFLGLPEGRLAMGNACVYLALAPRSNAVLRALGKASQAIKDFPAAEVPLAIRNAPTPWMKSQGFGKDYQYAHDLDDGVADMQCLPEELQGRRFFEATGRGFEKRLLERIKEIERLKKGGN